MLVTLLEQGTSVQLTFVSVLVVRLDRRVTAGGGARVGIYSTGGVCRGVRVLTPFTGCGVLVEIIRMENMHFCQVS